MSRKIRALLVDDEPLARSRIRNLLKHETDIELAGECCDGLEAISSIRELSPDLVFLDVQMPEVDGFQVIEKVGPEKMRTVIFITAYDEYAVRAFEVCALDYLLKPFDEKRFRESLDRARKQIRSTQDQSAQVLELLENWKGKHDHLQRIMIKSSGRLVFLNVREIDWISSEANYVRLHTGKTSQLFRHSLNQLERELDPESFLRIHRSTIVNVQRVRQIEPLFHGDYRVTLLDGTELPLSRNYRRRLDRFGLTK